MNQSALAKWLKFIIVLVAVCGVIFYGGVIPFMGLSLVEMYPELNGCFWPWLIFLSLTAAPCYGALAFAWKIASNIGKNRSFVRANAKYLKRISVLAVINSAYFFAGNLVFFFLNMNHPSVLGASVILIFFGIAVAVASAVLSSFVNRAAELQEQYDLTV